MFAEPCADKRLLIQADVDGELDVATAAAVATHVAGCPACAAWRDGLIGLSAALAREVTRPVPPQRLRAAIESRLAAVETGVVTPIPARRAARWPMAAAFGVGLAMAASVALVILPPNASAPAASELLDSHMRALQPGHLTDVVSTDRHTVKPWFDGKLDFSPPVRDLAADGFPLIGGRLDRLEGRTVAVLSYARRAHVIDVYIQPARPGDARAEAATERGYGVRRWSAGDLAFAAITDVEPADLDRFVERFRAGGVEPPAAGAPPAGQ